MTSAAIPPGPDPGALTSLRTLLRFRRDPLTYMTRVMDQYGDVVRYRLGTSYAYALRHPDHIRHVLVTHQHDFVKGRGIQWTKKFLGEGLLTSEGEFHTRQRRLAQPAFHRQRISRYADIMVSYAVRTAERWQPGAAIPLDREMNALTLEIATRTLFDTEVASEAAEIGRALSDIIVLFPRFALPFADLIDRLPLPSNRRFLAARERLDTLVYRIIAERRKDGRDHGDLLSMLMQTTDVEGDGGSMDDRQLRDEVMTLLLAGHETTANALTWTFYLLSENPAAAERLQAELSEVLCGRDPGFDDIPRLAYTERVFAESMRIYPPAWGFGRRVLRAQEIGGYAIPEGAYLVMFPWVTHRDPRWFPDPLRFDPDRFTPEAKAARPKGAYIPFSAGARNCIGEPFAWMEGVLLLATLLQRWRLQLVPGHPVVPQALVTLRPRHGMPMTVHARG